MAGGLYLMATAQIHWQVKVIERHWEEGEFSFGVQNKILYNKKQIVSIDSDVMHINFFNAETGRIVNRININNKQLSYRHNRFSISSNGNAIIIENKDGGESFLVKNNQRIELPRGDSYYFSDLEQNINYKIDSSLKTGQSSINSFTAYLYSIEKNRIISKVSSIAKHDKKPSEVRYCYFDFNSNGDRLVSFSRENGRNVIVLYDAILDKKNKNSNRSR